MKIWPLTGGVLERFFTHLMISMSSGLLGLKLSVLDEHVPKTKMRVRDKGVPYIRSIQRQFSENICSEDDLRLRIFGTFVVKFLACLPVLGFSDI